MSKTEPVIDGDKYRNSEANFMLQMWWFLKELEILPRNSDNLAVIITSDREPAFANACKLVKSAFQENNIEFCEVKFDTLENKTKAITHRKDAPLTLMEFVQENLFTRIEPNRFPYVFVKLLYIGSSPSHICKPEVLEAIKQRLNVIPSWKWIPVPIEEGYELDYTAYHPRLKRHAPPEFDGKTSFFVIVAIGVAVWAAWSWFTKEDAKK